MTLPVEFIAEGCAPIAGREQLLKMEEHGQISCQAAMVRSSGSVFNTESYFL